MGKIPDVTKLRDILTKEAHIEEEYRKTVAQAELARHRIYDIYRAANVALQDCDHPYLVFDDLAGANVCGYCNKTV